jgi:hypothetical protein
MNSLSTIGARLYELAAAPFGGSKHTGTSHGASNKLTRPIKAINAKDRAKVTSTTKVSPNKVTKRQAIGQGKGRKGAKISDKKVTLPFSKLDSAAGSDNDEGFEQDHDMIDIQLASSSPLKDDRSSLTSFSEIRSREPETPPPSSSQDFGNTNSLEVDQAFSGAKRRTAKEDLRTQLLAQGWCDGEILLAVRLNSRGREPLLPTDWERAFSALPLQLFGKGTVINAVSEVTFRATRALEGLFGLGAAVRSNRQAGKPTEALIKAELNRYIKWAEKDGGVCKCFLSFIWFISFDVQIR